MFSILIVDDDVLALDGLKNGLHFQAMGFDQAFFASGMRSACDILTRQPIDVLVADIEMPGGTGIDLQKWVLERGLRPVTVFFTCHASFDYAQHAISLKIFDYILKPIRYAELEGKLRKALMECPRWQAAHPPKADALPGEESAPSLAQRIKQYIDAHIAEELTREELGRAFFLNPDYVARIFKQEEKESLTNYIRSRRVRIAQKMLAETDRPLEEICQAVGFSYNTYFFHTFKSITSVSPSQYRKRGTPPGDSGTV